MTTPTMSKVLDVLLAEARPLMLRHFTQRSCIAATRLTVELLGYYGYKAEPVPCRLDVLNPVATEVVRAGETLTAEHQAAGAWMVSVAGAGTLGTSPRFGDAAWDGHLVAFVPAPTPNVDGIIVDLSLDQARRPVKEILVDPTMFAVAPGWRDRPFGVDLNGCAVIYNVIDNAGYRKASDWKRDVTGRAIGQIIRTLRPIIESPSTTTTEESA